MQVTVVPRPTAESSFTVPPCSSTKERTIDKPSPAPRCSEPSAWLSKRSNRREPEVGGENSPPLGRPPFGGKRNDVGGRREADRVGEKIEQHLPHAALVRHEAAGIRRHAHVEQ